MKKLNSYKYFIKENQEQVLQLSKFANMIDFYYTRTDATKEGINEIIDLTKLNNFYGIVVNPNLTDYLSYELDESDVTIKCITTIDFPDGDASDVDRLSMVIEAISDGSDEIVTVLNYKWVKDAYIEQDQETKDGLIKSLEDGIRLIADECHKNAIILKVVVESGLLTLEELTLSCQISSNAGADYIQTSTGTKSIGSELSKVKEMRRVLDDHVKICVAGGIRTLEQMQEYYPYCDRFGVSVIPK